MTTPRHRRRYTGHDSLISHQLAAQRRHAAGARPSPLGFVAHPSATHGFRGRYIPLILAIAFAIGLLVYQLGGGGGCS
jgi:hypothetical protein